MPNIKAMEEYNLTHREKRVILDEVKGLKVLQKINIHEYSFLYSYRSIVRIVKEKPLFSLLLDLTMSVKLNAFSLIFCVLTLKMLVKLNVFDYLSGEICNNVMEEQKFTIDFECYCMPKKY